MKHVRQEEVASLTLHTPQVLDTTHKTLEGFGGFELEMDSGLYGEGGTGRGMSMDGVGRRVSGQ